MAEKSKFVSGQPLCSFILSIGLCAVGNTFVRCVGLDRASYEQLRSANPGEQRFGTYRAQRLHHREQGVHHGSLTFHP